MKNEFLVAIAAALGLSETAEGKDIVTAAKERFSALDGVQTELANIRKALKLADDAEIDTVIETASQLTNAKAEKPNPSEYVPVSVHEELASQLKELQDDRTSEKAEAAVASALKEGKITPAQKEWATDYATSDLAKFQEFVEKAPVVVASGETHAGSKPASSQSKLSETQAQIASQLGLTEDEYLDTASE